MIWFRRKLAKPSEPVIQLNAHDHVIAAAARGELDRDLHAAIRRRAHTEYHRQVREGRFADLERLERAVMMRRALRFLAPAAVPSIPAQPFIIHRH